MVSWRSLRGLSGQPLRNATEARPIREAIIRLRVLGPLEVCRDGAWTSISAGMERTLLACLIVHLDAPVSTDWLIETLWPDDRRPQRPHKRVQMLIWRLRGRLADPDGELLRTADAGYVLRLDSRDVDAARFEELVDEGSAALRDDDAERAVDCLTQAFELWRGAAYADIASVSAVDAETERLAQLRLAACEDRADAELRCGRHAEQVAALESLVTSHPFRERLTGLLMLALYRSGRQAEALEAYTRTRAVLADELGIDPGVELQRMQQRILESDPSLATPANEEPQPVAAQLPGDLPVFAAREAEVAGLLKLGESSPVAAAVIGAISGTAGVGKTTLAIHAAHQLADRFPDGQLYVDLRGFDASGRILQPTEAIRGFLDALGVASERIPVDADAQAGLYRSLLHDRRVLVVLDNARDSDQVRPLLPGSAGCLTIVTSRNDLSGLVAREGATPIAIDTLDTSEARRLIADRLGAERVAAEPEAVDTSIELCAGLPLALAIVASRAATHPRFPLSALAAELRSGLDALTASDQATDTRAVFSWSYRQLSSDAARLFRLLGLHPGPDISAAAAASLAGLAPERVAPQLNELTYANLIHEHVPGRYAFHDLLRAYAAERSHAEDTETQRNDAIHRVLDHYVHTAYAHTTTMSPARQLIPLTEPRCGVTPETVADQKKALAWFMAEHHVLLNAVAQAYDLECDTHVVLLTWAISVHLGRQGHWKDHVRVWRMALDAALRSGDRSSEALAHRHFARGVRMLGRLDDSECHISRSLRLYRELNDRTGEAEARRGFVPLLIEQGRYAEAYDHARYTTELYEDSDQQSQLSDALNALAWCAAHLGRYREAIDTCQRALTQIAEPDDDPTTEANTLDTLGYAHHHLGDFEMAIDYYRASLIRQQQVSDLYFESETLAHLGDSQHAAGDTDGARESWGQALAILDDLDHANAAEVRRKLDALG